MTIADKIREAVEELPTEKQAEVLDFVEFLRARAEANAAERPKRVLGTFAGKVTIAEDFDAPLPPEIQRYFDGEDDDDGGAV